MSLSDNSYWELFIKPISLVFGISISIYFYLYVSKTWDYESLWLAQTLTRWIHDFWCLIWKGIWLSGLGTALFYYTQLFIQCDFGDAVKSAVSRIRGVIMHRFHRSIVFLIHLEWNVGPETSWNALVFNVYKEPIGLCTYFESTSARRGPSNGTIRWARFWEIIGCNYSNTNFYILYELLLNFFRWPSEFIPLSWCWGNSRSKNHLSWIIKRTLFPYAIINTAGSLMFLSQQILIE